MSGVRDSLVREESAEAERPEDQFIKQEPSVKIVPEEKTAQWGHSPHQPAIKPNESKATAFLSNFEVNYKQFSLQKYCGNTFICCKLFAHFVTPATLTACYLVETTDQDIFLLFADASRRRLLSLRQQQQVSVGRTPASLETAEFAPTLLRAFQVSGQSPQAPRPVKQQTVRLAKNLWIPAFSMRKSFELPTDLLRSINDMFGLTDQPPVTAVPVANSSQWSVCTSTSACRRSRGFSGWTIRTRTMRYCRRTSRCS